MFSVISGTGISLASLSEPQVTMEGRLLSIEGRYAEAALDSENLLARGSLVQFQTSEILYFGEIESAWSDAGTNRIRVLIEHSLDLDKAAAIRRLWNADNAE